MFFKKKDGKAGTKLSAGGAKKNPAKSIGRAPLTAYELNRAEWAERNGDATVNQGRLFILAVCGFVASTAMAVALVGITPLKEVIPYEITFNRDTGETQATRITATKFVPDQVQKGYFIARWVRQMLALDPFTTERDLAEAFGLVRGKAVAEVRDFISSTQPIARIKKDRSLTRTVNISTLQFLDENIAQIRVVTQERTATGSAQQKRFVVTLHFVLEPPKDDRQMLENPIGLYIVHFNISEEMQ
jgi:type IV secretory pathway TrbF-like protein